MTGLVYRWCACRIRQLRCQNCAARLSALTTGSTLKANDPPLPPMPLSYQPDCKVHAPKRGVAMGVQSLQDDSMGIRETINGRVMLKGPHSNVRVYIKIRAMEIGQTIIIRKAVWKGETPLGKALQNSGKYRGRFSVLLREDKTGWRVTRLT